MAKSTFLIVDDQKSITLLLKQKLDKCSPIPVITCHSLAEAQQVIQDPSTRVEICLCDLNLPDAPRGETIDLLNENQITTVVLSGSFDEPTRQAVAKKQVADFVVKDSPAAIDYAVKILLNLLRNTQKEMLLISSQASHYRPELEALIRRQRYQLNSQPKLPNPKNLGLDSPLPAMVVIENSAALNEQKVMSFISQIRNRYAAHQLPIMLCEPIENITNAIKLMKYGINDFFNTSATEEEVAVRLRQNIELAESYQEVEFFSQIDPLTELFNRRHFFSLAIENFNNAKKLGKQNYVVMIDIDLFKSVNDTYGHQKGDDVIRYTADLLQNSFKQEIIARFGGEEFCVYGSAQAEEGFEQTLLNKVQLLLKTIDTQADIDTGVAFTVSAGVSLEGENICDAINLADKALYKAKENGRNQVILGETP